MWCGRICFFLFSLCFFVLFTDNESFLGEKEPKCGGKKDEKYLFHFLSRTEYRNVSKNFGPINTDLRSSAPV